VNWGAVTLGEIADIKTGKLDVNAGTPEGKYPFFTCAQKKYAIDFYDYDCECILVAGNGDLNVKYFKGKFNAYQRTYIITKKAQADLDIKYLYYFIDSYIERLREGAIGGVIKYIKLGHLTDMNVPLPPLPVQKQIAAVLEKAGTLRNQCEQMEQELNSLAQSVFLDMFGDYKTSDQSDFMTLGDCANVCSGVTKGQKFGDKPTVTVPYMRVANVQDGYLDLNEIKEIEAKITDYEKYLLKVGDVLMTEGGDFDKLGRGAVWEGQIDGCIHQNHVFRVRLDERYLPKFFEYLLQSQYAKQYFLKCAKKTTNLASINITQLKSLPMPQVDLKLQQEFVSFISKLDKHKQYLEQTKQQLDENFNSLMQRAFKGELELKDVA
jgi:type I restriction enzyme S subunit